MIDTLSLEQALVILNGLFASNPRTVMVQVSKDNTELSMFLEGDPHIQKAKLLEPTHLDILRDRVKQNPSSNYPVPPEVRYFDDDTAYLLFIRIDASLR